MEPFKKETLDEMFCKLRDLILLSGQHVASRKMVIPVLDGNVELMVFLTNKEVGEGLDHFLGSFTKRSEVKPSSIIKV